MRRFPPDLVRELATWNEGVQRAREEYAVRPNLNWCAVLMCWNRAHAKGFCIGHKRALVSGASVILDEQIGGRVR